MARTPHPVLRGEAVFKTIQTGVVILQGIIQMRGHFNLNDLGVMAEDFFAGLLNLAYDLKLQNLNRISTNIAAIDLGDTDKKICFQVTAENKKTKVQHTLNLFAKAGLNKTYTSLRFLMMSTRQG